MGDVRSDKKLVIKILLYCYDKNLLKNNNILYKMNFWFKKVKKGGQMLGDDLLIPDVQRAVQTFSVKNNMKFDILTLPNKNYPIFRCFKD